MENTVEYRVFLNDTVLTEGDSNFEELLSTCVAYLSPLFGDYIWQKEPFFLRLKSAEKEKGLGCICVCYCCTYAYEYELCSRNSTCSVKATNRL